MHLPWWFGLMALGLVSTEPTIHLLEAQESKVLHTASTLA
jgi:hypothetical protein